MHGLASHFAVRFVCRSLIASALILIETTSADCYNRDGVFASQTGYYGGPGLISCGMGTNNCCFPDNRCGSNLLCLDRSGRFTRQYCAAKDWARCSALCPDSNTAGLVLTYCGTNVFCCGAGNTQCCKEGAGFFVDPKSGDVTPVALGSSGDIKMVEWWTVDNSTTQITTSTTSSTASETLSLSVISSITPISSSATGLSMPGASPSSIPNNETILPKKLSIGAGAGIGVGATLFAIGIILCIWLFVVKYANRHQNSHRKMHESRAHRDVLEMDGAIYELGEAHRQPRPHVHEMTAERT